MNSYFVSMAISVLLTVLQQQELLPAIRRAMLKVFLAIGRAYTHAPDFVRAALDTMRQWETAWPKL